MNGDIDVEVRSELMVLVGSHRNTPFDRKELRNALKEDMDSILHHGFLPWDVLDFIEDIVKADRTAIPIILDELAIFLRDWPTLNSLSLADHLISRITHAFQYHPIGYESHIFDILPSDDEIIKDTISAVDGLITSYLSMAKDIIEGDAHDPPYSTGNLYPSDIIAFFRYGRYILPLLPQIDRTEDLQEMLIDESLYIKTAMQLNPYVRPTFLEYLHSFPHGAIDMFSEDVFSQYLGAFIGSDFLYEYMKLFVKGYPDLDEWGPCDYPELFKAIIYDSSHESMRSMAISSILHLLAGNWGSMAMDHDFHMVTTSTSREERCSLEEIRQIYGPLAPDILKAARSLDMDLTEGDAWALITAAEGDAKKDIMEQFIRMIPEKDLIISRILIGGEIEMRDFEEVFYERVKSITFTEHFPLGTVSVTVSSLEDAIWYQLRRKSS